jgi:hypothetical protein
MSNNIASFDEFDTDQQIEAHQACLVRVILEGKTDVELFSRFWFQSLQETFLFIEASRLGAGAGCTGVEAAVVHSRTVDRISAVGIVDKDTLFRSREWARVFSLPDAEIPADWDDALIYITSRWEVEAYLLEPDHLEPWVTVEHKNPPASLAEAMQALARTLDACELVLRMAPFLAAQHEAGKKIKPKFLHDQPEEQILNICRDQIEASDVIARTVAGQVQALIDTIIASQPNEGVERLPFLLRYVDTKRLLFRLAHVLNMRGDPNWVALAQHMKLVGRRPVELEQVLRSVEAAPPMAN